MRSITTTDLSEFGYREIEMARDLLDAWVENGLPDEFDYDEVKIMFNKNSGYVFLTNSQFQVCMLKDGRLDMWYTCPECGKEGFDEDLEEYGNECCKEYIGK